ncbi:Rieske (2Fe-2S) protein [Streptacidiphilus albus]|uniref:Rieske (2Fe-2S) protein n=1 Tax=Streptacidiphilus albus TaxID=105425 RepID=UPI0009DE145B|nr:Rieske (2Fe-2S) protein [Streptacidiphilus albus]
MSQPTTAPLDLQHPAESGAEPCCGGCGPSRRSLLRGAAAVGVAGAAAVGLAACSSGSSGSSSSSASGPTTLGPTSDVAVGGGKLYKSDKVVVTQPTAGVFKAFSAICTHQGCLVDGVSSGVIQCPCHGSEFNITTGAVVQGPAPTPLPEKTLTVSDGKIVVTL